MAEKKDIPGELIDALRVNYEKPDDLLGRNGSLEQLTKRVVERALETEMALAARNSVGPSTHKARVGSWTVPE